MTSISAQCSLLRLGSRVTTSCVVVAVLTLMYKSLNFSPQKRMKHAYWECVIKCFPTAISRDGFKRGQGIVKDILCPCPLYPCPAIVIFGIRFSTIVVVSNSGLTGSLVMEHLITLVVIS